MARGYARASHKLTSYGCVESPWKGDRANLWAMATAQGFKGTLPGSKRRITTEEVILVAVDMMASAEILFTVGIFSPMLQEAQVGLWREKC